MANKSEGPEAHDQKRREIQAGIERANKVSRPTFAATAILLVVATVFVAYVSLHACTAG
jgi:SNF family Na+-dependent transporter